jgi:hypothetical protein
VSPNADVKTGLDVAPVGAWVAAAELPPARRRLAGALTAVTVGVAIPGVCAGRSAEPATPGAGARLPFVDVGTRLPDADTWQSDGDGCAWLAVAGECVGAAVASMMGRMMTRPSPARPNERLWVALIDQSA